MTFNRNTLPNSVHIGWDNCSVREYIPRPRRCYNCQKFGHGGRTCRSSTAICVQCAAPSHGPCDNEPVCSNCSLPHPAYSRDCPMYQLEQETLNIQARQRVSYREAKEMARRWKISHTTSYASIARTTQPTVSSQKKNLNQNQHAEELKITNSKKTGKQSQTSVKSATIQPEITLIVFRIV